MNPDATIIKAVERLDYRATVGDVAAQAGIDINLAQQGLLVLASAASGHLQVAESGEVVYVFPKNIRSILLNKSLRLRLKQGLATFWQALFYFIRLSFGIVLILLIVLAIVAIGILIVAISSSRGSNNDDRDNSFGGGGFFYLPRLWFGPDLYWMFSPNYQTRQHGRQRARDVEGSQMNFLEAIFSFLFGDGNPNTDLEERRWQTVAMVIRNHRGAVTAEQISPYLDKIGQGFDQEYEAYMLPVLTRFAGQPEVSPEGDIVYRFPELQTSVAQTHTKSVAAYLKETPWRFSQASSGQVLLSAGLGAVLFVLSLVLNSMAWGQIAGLSTSIVAFIHIIAWLSLAYSVAYLAIPLLRYFWVQWRNRRIEARNETRQARAIALNEADAALQKKLAYAQQFASETIVQDKDIVYTTERDLTEQELERSAQIDQEWQQRLNQTQNREH
ncbi:MAG: hypothetical protein KME16_17225 [Scytolyngbya sp. HA4215-MV1]|jgi:hypothetical protein|nr:hypothetical protein [Scytolyngbya sp. HA4215-MV1]